MDVRGGHIYIKKNGFLLRRQSVGKLRNFGKHMLQTKVYFQTFLLRLLKGDKESLINVLCVMYLFFFIILIIEFTVKFLNPYKKYEGFS